MDFEVARTHVYTATYFVGFQREKLLKDKEPILEVGVGHFQPQLDEHIVVLVVGDAEAITFEHFSVCHASIAEENLRSFWEGILTSLEDEGEVLGHVVDNLVPDCLSHVFAHFNFLLTSIGLAHLCKFTRFDAMTIVAESLLFDKQVKIVVTFKTT